MAEKSSWFVDVLLPLPLKDTYTYSITADQKNTAKPGCRVTVQFGRKKLYTALIVNIHQDVPQGFAVKEIITVIDDDPVVNPVQLKLWKWISDYYLCKQGEVMKAALPSGLKLESESRVYLKTAHYPENELTDNEQLVRNLLLNYNTISISKLTTLSEKKDLIPVIKSLTEKGLVIIEEHLKEGYKPKIVPFVYHTFDLKDEALIGELFNRLEKAPKQLEAMMTYLSLSKAFNKDAPAEIEKSFLIEKGAPPAALTALIRKGLLKITDREVGRINEKPGEIREKAGLNNAQEKAFQEINKHFFDKDVVLLHGVTSSGKTEIYIHLISEQIATGKQVLYLLPEIALTTQIITRLKTVFGNKVGVYHSKFSDHERVEVWNNLSGHLKTGQEKYKIILGVRSSIFLPFNNLGLIIVDEEHENTYKQFDPAPRYHARDTAIVLASLHHAKTLLGTATPSLESYFNIETGKYALVNLNERYLNLEMPDIKVADVREARKKKQMQSLFTPLLLNSISNALENKEQVILFQNRRGFSPYLECDICGWIPVCNHCDVSLTYHKNMNRLICHYCGYTMKNPKTCHSCGGTSLLTKGFGTEKIEDEITIFFPGKKIARLDLDSARSRKAYEQIISGFESGEIDILIGTQMISKGLDFNNVKVVGILNADNMLNFPDFRSHERSFQLMAQVSGRAGRKNSKGLVIIQTSERKHPIIHYVVDNDYNGMFVNQLNERKQFKYPPFYRLIEIVLKHKKNAVLDRASEKLGDMLKKEFGNRVMGPEFPLINRIQDYYLKRILIKLEKNSSIGEKKQRLTEITETLLSTHEFNNLQINIDVDPM